MEFLFGIVGFVGFESLKIYKRTWRGGSFSPRRHVFLYCVSLLGLGILSGVGAIALAPSNFAGALFLGFSIPNGIKALGEPAHAPSTESAVSVDDVDIDSGRIRAAFATWYDLMFAFR